ncbi:MAG: ATP synthase F1 subunit delta [Flavobacteriales bacterium AspAUS03]
MKTSRVARRYAKGLFEYALDMGKRDVVHTDMKNLGMLARESCELQLFLQSPLLNSRRKIKVARVTFKFFSEISQRFIELLILHKREALLGLVVLEYQKIYQIAQGIVEVVVTTVVPLDKVLQEQIVDKIGQVLRSDKKYVLINEVNPLIIGGFLLRVGGQQWDSTVIGQLARFRKELLDYDYVKRY